MSANKRAGECGGAALRRHRGAAACTAAVDGRERTVAVVGAGVTGLAQADVFQRCGFSVVVFERSHKMGGVWSACYYDAALQNSYHQYHISSFPWPFQPDLHPPAEQIVDYLERATKALCLDVRRGHEVRSVRPDGAGWRVVVSVDGGPDQPGEFYDHVVISVGHFGNEHKLKPSLPGEDVFGGAILTERDIVKDPEAVLAGRHVVVVGFGKAALDMVATAVDCGAAGQVHHVFRDARWMVPTYFLGFLHASYAMLPRIVSSMIPCWTYPGALERFIHTACQPMLNAAWSLFEVVVKATHRMSARMCAVPAHAADGATMPPPPPPAASDPAVAAAAAAALELVLSPAERFQDALRSATLLPPRKYCGWVRGGYIDARRGEIARYIPGGVELKDGSTIKTDVVIWGVGSVPATFPFLPKGLRSQLEADADGAQLYRHLILPSCPSIGFGGYNASFQAFACAEVGALWLAALWQGHLQLPPVSEMEAVVEAVKAWKRKHLLFTSCRVSSVAARSLQYLDVALKDLGLNPYRKLPNVLAELFGRYGSSDYAGLVEEFRRVVEKRKGLPLRPLPLAM